MMKKLLSLLIALLFTCTTIPAFSSEDPRIDELTAALDEVMQGTLARDAANRTEAELMAPKLKTLSEITTKDLAVFAANKKLDNTKVQDAYYSALANALSAQLMIDPDSASQYKAVQQRLDQRSGSSASSGTSSAQKQNASTTSRSTNTPDRNTNNTPDRAASTSSGNTTASSGSSQKQNASTTSRSTNTPDRNTYNTPDRNTPDHNTPDRNTPDHNTPDRNSPDRNTPDRNTRNSPDRNT